MANVCVGIFQLEPGAGDWDRDHAVSGARAISLQDAVGSGVVSGCVYGV